MATTKEKIMATLLSVIIFILISLPFTYNITNGLLGGKLLDSSNCPTLFGIIVHAAAFGIIVFILMELDLF
jgi:riboflavin transporter FmnP